MSTLEETLREAPQEDAWKEDLSRLLDEQRERAKKLIAEQRERFGKLNAQMIRKLTDLSEELARHEAQAQNRTVAVISRETSLKQQADYLTAQQDDLRRQREEWENFRRQSQERHQHLLDELHKRLAQLDTRRTELDGREHELGQQQEDVRRRQSELDRGNANLNDRQQELVRKEEELAQQRVRLEELQRAHKSEAEQLTRNMAELNQIQVHFDQQRQALAEREREIARQRRNIARQLRSRKKELATEKELLHSEARSSSAGNELHLQQRLAELQDKYERMTEEVSHHEQQRDELTERVASLQGRLEQREAEAARLAAVETKLREAEKQRDELSRHQEQFNNQGKARDAEIDQLNERIRSLNDRCTQQADQIAHAEAAFNKQRREWEEQGKHSASPAVAAELDRLREENQRLEASLRDAAQGIEATVAQQMDDLKRRLDLATQECRDLKSRNSELLTQLETGRANGSVMDDGAMDWESQKRRMLAQLEAAADGEPTEEQNQEKLSLEEAIQKTDQAIAAKQREVEAKDQEIQELRSLLQNQAGSIGDMAVGASAIAGVLDNDELIKQERESLQKLQDGLREQLRKAEIELSMERAKIAREKAEMESKLQTFESEKAKHAVAAGPQAGAESGKKSSRGRWLARLGLRDDK